MSDVNKSTLFRKLTLKSPARKQSQSNQRPAPRRVSSTPALERSGFSSLRERAPPPPPLDVTTTAFLSQVFASSKDAAAPTPTEASTHRPHTVLMGTQEVPLSSVVLGVAILLVFFVLWRAFLASSGTIIRLMVLIIVVATALLLTPLKDQLQPLPTWVATPHSSGFIYTAPNADDTPLKQSQRQHGRQASLR